MKLALKYDLPFIDVTVIHQDASITIPGVLVDTGSASTILSADILANMNILPLASDTLRSIRGVGGRELVFSRIVNCLQVDQCKLKQFEIEVGGMDYGYEINGILGMDFLTKAKALINLKKLTLDFLDI